MYSYKEVHGKTLVLPTKFLLGKITQKLLSFTTEMCCFVELMTFRAMEHKQILQYTFSGYRFPGPGGRLN